MPWGRPHGLLYGVSGAVKSRRIPWAGLAPLPRCNTSFVIYWLWVALFLLRTAGMLVRHFLDRGSFMIDGVPVPPPPHSPAYDIVDLWAALFQQGHWTAAGLAIWIWCGKKSDFQNMRILCRKSRDHIYVQCEDCHARHDPEFRIAIPRFCTNIHEIIRGTGRCLAHNRIFWAEWYDILEEKAKDRRARRADQRAAVDTIAGRNFVWTAGNTHGLPPFRPEGLSAAQLVPHLFRPEVLGRFPAEVGNEQQRLEAHWRTYDEPTVGQLMALPFLPHQTHVRTITPPEAPMHIDDMVFFGIGLFHKRLCLCSMCILLRRERRLL